MHMTLHGHCRHTRKKNAKKNYHSRDHIRNLGGIVNATVPKIVLRILIVKKIFYYFGILSIFKKSIFNPF